MGAIGKIGTISFFTMKEILKSKVLLNVFFIGLGMMLVIYVASEFTYGVPEKVALDFGLGTLWFSSVGISLFIGANLIAKEMESRTVYMIISRPVPRYAFILGKILGLFLVLLINILLLSSMTLTATYFLGGKISEIVYWALIYNVVEALLLLLIVIFFSLLANTIICVLGTMVLMFAGHFIQETQSIVFVQGYPLLKDLLNVYHYVLPGFYKLNLKSFVVYQQTLPVSYLWTNLFYGLTYSGFVLCVILFIFERKNLD